MLPHLVNPVELQSVATAGEADTGAALVDLWTMGDAIKVLPYYKGAALEEVLLIANGDAWLAFIDIDATPSDSADMTDVSACQPEGEHPAAGTLPLVGDYLTQDSGTYPWVNMSLTYDGAQSLMISYTDEAEQPVTVNYRVEPSVGPDAP